MSDEITIIYGMTRTDPFSTYRPMSEGWKRLPDGRMPAQDLIVFSVEPWRVEHLTSEQVAERVFIATNAPDRGANEADLLLETLAHQLDTMGEPEGARFVAGADEPAYLRSLSIGDTVTVEGRVSVACLARGWREVS